MEYQSDAEQSQQVYQNRVNEFLVSLMFGWELWAIVGGALGILVLFCLWPDSHREEYQQRAYIQQTLQDDPIWSLLAQGGGMQQSFQDHYELVVPQGADNKRLITYYQTVTKYPKRFETREVLEVLQTRGVVYSRIYVGNGRCIDQAFREDHPELVPSFNLQNRPSPQR